MADENLTEGELDELLKDVELTEEQKNAQMQEQSLQGAPAKTFNLGTQERLVRGRMPTIETVHERFIRLLRITASNLFGALIEVKTSATTTCKYGELLSKHSQPSNINLIKLKPLRGTGLLIIDPNLVLYTVDNLFGGGARFPVSIEGREFTATEMRIVGTLLKTFFTSYQEAWAPAYEIECEHVNSEMNLSFVNIAMASELMSTTTFTLAIGEASYEIDLCIPYMMLEPIMDILTSQTQGMVAEHDHVWEETLLQQVEAVEVEVVANLGNKTMLMEEIIALKSGDVIPFPYSAEIPVTVDNVPVLSCRYGIYNNQYALRVEKLLKPDASEYIKGANDGK
ncbi:flagellar motor switch protein FliM [Polynucleobacter sp. AP-Sanab-80-C2]|uniref:flagellar motor switch protein FliM n=1 Tax=Polynucleobacter sp. AP-Sanab-80-C2 TaxID=3108274 RepID=UPI002B23BFD6|nr:flagellar motor switch protein FliM [Polynucleobacter sp. AP-Sanab-80-C2]MEA9599073.1 flagellar motor switch protein FliM [Polynucleobacter sp. AP-Sanab-80-C2]